jgi:integrase
MAPFVQGFMHGAVLASRSCHNAVAVRGVTSARETAEDVPGAEILLTQLQARVDEDRQPKSDLTVRQAIDQWLEVARLEDTTRDRYDDLIRIYIGPTLGSMRATKLDAQMHERWYARLQRCRSACDSRRRAMSVSR